MMSTTSCINIHVCVVLSCNIVHSCSFFCTNGTLDARKVKGKILVCLRGVNGRVEKGAVAASLGAVGMILANRGALDDEIISDPHVLPATHVNFETGKYIFSYINRTK